MSQILAALEEAVRSRKVKGTIRSLYITDDQHVDFSSNDFLSLARSDDLRKQIAEELLNTGQFLGATGSRLLTGNNELYEAIENEINQELGDEGTSALLFNSGYDCNLSVWGALPQAHHTVLWDMFSHNSIREGIRLSRAKSMPFEHNDLEDLETKLVQQPRGTCLIAVEGVYSMDGDTAPVREMCDLADKYGAGLIVDEAHSFGVYGPRGRGLVHEQGMAGRVFCTLYPFGKAVAHKGAVMVGPPVMREYLINYARPLIYSTALPLTSLLAIRASLRMVYLADAERQSLKELVRVFRTTAKEAAARTSGFRVLDSQSHIQGVVIPGNAAVLKAAEMLKEHGFTALAIRSPTVPEGQERLRIVLHAHNTPIQVVEMLGVLETYTRAAKEQ